MSGLVVKLYEIVLDDNHRQCHRLSICLKRPSENPNYSETRQWVAEAMRSHHTPFVKWDRSLLDTFMCVPMSQSFTFSQLRQIEERLIIVGCIYVDLDKSEEAQINLYLGTFNLTGWLLRWAQITINGPTVWSRCVPNIPWEIDPIIARISMPYLPKTIFNLFFNHNNLNVT